MNLPLSIEAVLEFCHLIATQRDDSSLDVLGILLELHTESLGFECRLELLVNMRLSQGLLDNELLLGLVGVDSQIIC